jgi:hypothetical protein
MKIEPISRNRLTESGIQGLALTDTVEPPSLFCRSLTDWQNYQFQSAQVNLLMSRSTRSVIS